MVLQRLAESHPQALWESRDSDNEVRKKAFECTLGILFYGTPHRGGNYVDLGGALAHVVKATGHTLSTQVLSNLKHDSELLELLRKEFGKMLDADRFDVHSFYETKGLTFIRFGDKKVTASKLSIDLANMTIGGR